ncbi:MAG: hypothetical protein K5869_07515 [Saccharofermentans sp.]|nr:hypothetical protein [Saccharofermentans sp.]
MTSYTDVIETGKRQLLVADDEFINREIIETFLVTNTMFSKLKTARWPMR